MGALSLLGWFSVAPPAAGLTSEVVIEINAAAERSLDARSARRLVALELADVDLPAASRGAEPALFYRVLGEERGLVRVELWERGKLHDARLVSASGGSGQLVARRVALAAAELARDLRQRRLVERRREERRRAQLLLKARAARERMREGPVALRSAVGVVRGEELTLAGSSLSGELSLRGGLRVDFGGRLLLGQDGEGLARITWIELAVGPAHRFALGSALALDLGAFVAPAVVHIAGAEAVDAIASVRETWTARAGTALRLQPRLTRSLRASFGLDTSILLRSVAARFPGPREERYRGLTFGAELGLVFTPP